MASSSAKSSIAVGLLGDVMFGRGVAEARDRAPPESVWAPELRDLAASLDLLLCNLECGISTRGHPNTLIARKPFFFRGRAQ